MKYWQLFLVSWQNGLAYPISVLLWRMRQFLITFMSLTVWTVIFTGQGSAFAYSSEQMITYIFVVGVTQSLILATVMHSFAETIYTGRLSNELVKPVNVFGYMGVQEVADKVKNFGFIILETIILFLIFHPTIVIPNLLTVFLFALTTLLGAVIMFVIMLLFGTIGFWSPETWGPRFLFYMIIELTVGKFFPLDIFPQIIQRVLYFTPFPYLSYAQSQIFLGRADMNEIGVTFFMLFFWIFVLGAAFAYLWRKGMYEYGAMGH